MVSITERRGGGSVSLEQKEIVKRLEDWFEEYVELHRQARGLRQKLESLVEDSPSSNQCLALAQRLLGRLDALLEVFDTTSSAFIKLWQKWRFRND